MTVELLYNTPLWVCVKAIRTCWDSHDKSDTFGYKCGNKDKVLIERVGNKNKHKSTLEHLVYTFNIDGISRACLQELARHRLASLSVKSTRYTLKKLFSKCLDVYPDNIYTVLKEFVVSTGNEEVDNVIMDTLYNMFEVGGKISNDIAKYMLPEAFKTSLVWTINARSLQNFLELRSSKHALWEIQELAKAIYEALPGEHKYLFKDCLNEL